MMSQTHNTVDSVALLRELLNHEQFERLAIGKEIHDKLGDLPLIQFALHHMENDAKNGIFDPNKADEIKRVLTTYIEDTRTIMAKIFSNKIKSSGLKAGLKEIIRYCNDNHATELTIISELDETLSHADLLTQLGVYKVCSETTQFFCLAGYKEIEISLIPNGQNLVVNLLGQSQIQVELKQEKLEEGLNLIKANVIWRAAQILPETNWKNRFRFEFEYGMVKNK
jgi:hypothetical protein